MVMKKIFSESNLLYLRSERGEFAIFFLGVITFLTLLALGILLQFQFSSREESMHLVDNLYLLVPPNWYATRLAYPWLYPLLITAAIIILFFVSLLIYYSYRFIIKRSRSEGNYWELIQFSDGAIKRLVRTYSYDKRSSYGSKRYLIYKPSEFRQDLGDKEASMSFKVDIKKKDMMTSLKLRLFFDDFSIENFFDSIKNDISSDSDICDNYFYVDSFVEKILRINAASAIKDSSNSQDLKKDLKNNLIIPENLLGSARSEISVGYIFEN